jgi:UDP-N-acetylglucosamine 2-epimerase (non-hydrolysing)
MSKKILFISGARPNIIKLAPLYKRFLKEKKNICKILHSNQHSNQYLYKKIYKDLNLPNPDFIVRKFNTNNNINLLSYFMKNISKIIKKFKPDLIILFGDVDTTLAAGIAAKKSGIDLFHIESGLRSNDSKAQEEINRRLVDHLANINFATTKKSIVNLQKENLGSKSYFVGNIIFDNYFFLKDKIHSSVILKKLDIEKKKYILITIHRYQTINNKQILNKLIKILNFIAKDIKIVFACHSRTKKKLNLYNLFKNINKNIKIIEPLPYTDFTKLLLSSKLIITDSGGVHEEAFFHKINCFVLRDEIERKEFLYKNYITQITLKNILKKVKIALMRRKNSFNKSKSLYWDGKVSERIYKIYKTKYADKIY